MNEDIIWDNDFEGGYTEYLKKRLVNLKFEDKISVMKGFITSDIYMHIKQYKEHLKPKYLKKLNRGLKNDDLPEIYNSNSAEAAANCLNNKELSYKEGILRLQRWVRFYIYLKTGIKQYVERMAKMKEQKYKKEVKEQMEKDEIINQLIFDIINRINIAIAKKAFKSRQEFLKKIAEASQKQLQKLYIYLIYILFFNIF